MDLTLYQVIIGPWITGKAYMLNQRLKQLVLEVHPHANKVMVRQALKKLFNVDAEEVNVVVVKGKHRRAGRHKIVGKDRKKAIIILKAGHSLDLMGWAPPAAETTSPEVTEHVST